MNKTVTIIIAALIGICSFGASAQQVKGIIDKLKNPTQGIKPKPVPNPVPKPPIISGRPTPKPDVDFNKWKKGLDDIKKQQAELKKNLDKTVKFQRSIYGPYYDAYQELLNDRKATADDFLCLYFSMACDSASCKSSLTSTTFRDIADKYLELRQPLPGQMLSDILCIDSFKPEKIRNTGFFPYNPASDKLLQRAMLRYYRMAYDSDTTLKATDGMLMIGLCQELGGKHTQRDAQALFRYLSGDYNMAANLLADIYKHRLNATVDESISDHYYSLSAPQIRLLDKSLLRAGLTERRDSLLDNPGYQKFLKAK